LIDCADGDCGKPIIQSVTPDNPNCPALNNGKITITASGNNLEYSINGGNTYQSDAEFTGLTDGNYTITVRNTATTCVAKANLLLMMWHLEIQQIVLF